LKGGVIGKRQKQKQNTVIPTTKTRRRKESGQVRLTHALGGQEAGKEKGRDEKDPTSFINTARREKSWGKKKER